MKKFTYTLNELRRLAVRTGNCKDTSNMSLWSIINLAQDPLMGDRKEFADAVDTTINEMENYLVDNEEEGETEEPELIRTWDHMGWRKMGGVNPYKQEEWNQLLMTMLLRMRAILIDREERGLMERDVSIPNKLTVLDIDEGLYHLFGSLHKYDPHINPDKLGGQFLVRFCSPEDEPKLKEHRILFGDLKRGAIDVQNYKSIEDMVSEEIRRDKK